MTYDAMKNDPELEKLLAACRAVEPTRKEMEGWKSAVAAELGKSFEMPQDRKVEYRESHVIIPFRRVGRALIQVGVAASLGFVVGAYLMEKRSNEGAALLFSPPPVTEAQTTASNNGMETIHIRIE